MKKKIVRQVSPRTTLTIARPKLKLRGGMEGLLDITMKLSSVGWIIFILLLFPAYIIISQSPSGLGQLLWVYGFVAILLLLQLTKRLLSRGDYLPTVPYDIILLVFTTITAISLFVSTYSNATAGVVRKINIYGGADLRMLSGISMICFWFLYYLLIVNHATKDRFNRLLQLFAASAVLGVILNALTQNALFEGISIPMVLLLPAWIVLTLTQAKGRVLYALNIIISFAALLAYPQNVVIAAVVITFVAGLALLLVINRDHLKKLLPDFSKSTSSLIAKKISLGKYLQDNVTIFYGTIALLVIVIGGVQLLGNNRQPLFVYLQQGFSLINSNTGIARLLFGEGLVAYQGVFITQFIHSYGIVPLLILAVIIVLMLKDLLSLFLNSKDIELKGKALFLVLCMLPVVFFAFTMFPTDMLLIFLWLIMAFVGILKSVYVHEKEVSTNGEIINFNSVKNSNTRQLLRIMQIVVIIILALGTVYLLANIKSIIPLLK